MSVTRGFAAVQAIEANLMTTQTFNIGDLVELKSGGPVMTVYSVSRGGDHVTCEWFAGAKLEEGHFAMAMLQPGKPKTPAAKKAT